MTSYCNGSRKNAVVKWQFPGQDKERLIITNTPIEVDVYGIANNIGEPSNQFTAFDTGFKSDANYEISIFGLDPDRVYWIEGGNIYNIKSLTGSDETLYYSPLDYGVDRFESFSTNRRIYLFNGFRFRLFKREIAILQRFNTTIYTHPAIFWKIEVKDFIGRKFRKVGTGKPTYSVDCGGCPPNTLDCSGCCADCWEIKRKLGGINVRL